MKTTERDAIKVPVFILTLAGCLAACSGSRTVTLQPATQIEDLSQINKVIFDRKLTIRLLDGRVFEKTIGTCISGDSTTWLTSGRSHTWTEPTSALKEITYKDRGRGAKRGLAIGALTVFAVMLVAADSEIDDLTFSDRFEAAFLWGAPAGALYGAGIGALRGYRMKYKFRHPE